MVQDWIQLCTQTSRSEDMNKTLPLFRSGTCDCLLLLLAFSACPMLFAQGTLADYQRAQGVQAKAKNLVVNMVGPTTWIGESDHFWYPRTVKGGTEFVLVDATSGSKKLAFDHEKLAAAISAVTNHKYIALALPFAPVPGARPARPVDGAVPTTSPLTFLEGETAIQFGTGGSLYKCSLTSYTCTKQGPIPAVAAGYRDRGPEDESTIYPEERGGDPEDGLAYQPPAPQAGDEGRYGRDQRACAAQPKRAETQPRGTHNTEWALGPFFRASFLLNLRKSALLSTASGKHSSRISTSISNRRPKETPSRSASMDRKAIITPYVQSHGRPIPKSSLLITHDPVMTARFSTSNRLRKTSFNPGTCRFITGNRETR